MYVTAAFFAAAPLCDGFDVAPLSDGDHGCASHWREHSRVDRRLPAGWRRLRRWRWWATVAAMVVVMAAAMVVTKAAPLRTRILRMI